MTTQAQAHVSPGEYLDLERRAETRSEYHGGELFAMAGASYAHNLIVTNLLAELRAQLKGGPCAALPSDQRLWIESHNSFVYPDVTVVCGEPDFTDEIRDTLTNPKLLMEVLSKSTSSYDRGEKFELYRSIDSLKEYVLFAQDRPYCEHYERRTEGWLLTEQHHIDALVELPSISVRLAMAEVYDRVSLGPRAVARSGDQLK